MSILAGAVHGVQGLVYGIGSTFFFPTSAVHEVPGDKALHAKKVPIEEHVAALENYYSQDPSKVCFLDRTKIDKTTELSMGAGMLGTFLFLGANAAMHPEYFGAFASTNTLDGAYEFARAYVNRHRHNGLENTL